MYKHFSTKITTTITEAIKSLSKNDIKISAGDTIYTRGVGYINKVGDVEIAADQRTVDARVFGSYNYKVKINLKPDGTIWGKCSCPYDDTFCKHQVAVLLYIEKNAVEIIEITDATTTSNTLNAKVIEKHFENLDVSQLIDFILKNTPTDTLKSIELLYADQSQVLNLHIQAISTALKTKSLLKKPEALEKRITELLKKIKPFWASSPNQIVAMATKTILTLLELSDNGDLVLSDEDEGYDNYDYYDEYEGNFDTDFLKEYINDFLAQIPAINAKIDATETIAVAIYNEENYIFESLLNLDTIFGDESQFNDLKNIFIANFERDIFFENQEFFYKFIEDSLSGDEKMALLKKLSKEDDAFFMKELIDALIFDKNYTEALEHFEKFFKTENNFRYADIVKKYFICLEKLSKTNETHALVAITQNATDYELLKILIKQLPKLTEKLENISKKHSANSFVTYLETQNRLNEANELIKQSRSIVGSSNSRYASDFSQQHFNFYAKHGLSFTEDALYFFEKIIEVNMPHTGENYYKNVVDALVQIRKIDYKTFDIYIQDLRNNYKRRLNLMKMLKERCA